MLAGMPKFASWRRDIGLESKASVSSMPCTQLTLLCRQRGPYSSGHEALEGSRNRTKAYVAPAVVRSTSLSRNWVGAETLRVMAAAPDQVSVVAAPSRP